MINRLILDETNSMRELTEQVNDVTDTLTETDNIFKVVDRLEKDTNKYQTVKLTDNKGLAKVYNSNSLKDIKGVGYYIITAEAMATMQDKPVDTVSSDYTLQVIPTGNASRVVQVVYEARYTESQTMYYRYVDGESWSSWQHVETLENGKNKRISGKDVTNIETPGEFYVSSVEGLPQGVEKGYLTVIITKDDTKMLRLVDEETQLSYTKVKKQSGSWSGWAKEQTLEGISNYILGGLDKQVDMLVYKADDKSFYDALIEFKEASGKNNFTFYVQGGVKDSPMGAGSFRGLFMSERGSTYGWYIGVDNLSRVVNGALSGGTFREPYYPSSEQVIWSGALDMASVDKRQKMLKNINDFDVVKIYVKVQGTNQFNTGTFKTINNVGHEYFRDGETSFIVQGTLVGSVAASWDLYRCLVVFDGNEFYIAAKNTSVSTSNAKYITRIVGKKIQT